MKQNKYLIIGVSVLLITAILLFIFRKKIFKKSSAEVETDNINLDANTQPNATVSATATTAPLAIHTKKVGDRATSNARQEITRVTLENGKFIAGEKATIGKDIYIGVILQLTPNGYYIQGRKGLSAAYYYAGTSQVK